MNKLRSIYFWLSLFLMVGLLGTVVESSFGERNVVGKLSAAEEESLESFDDEFELEEDVNFAGGPIGGAHGEWIIYAPCLIQLASYSFGIPSSRACKLGWKMPLRI